MTYKTYKDLRSYSQASIIYDCTVEFCRRYIDPAPVPIGSGRYGAGRSYRSDRMTGQMEQAARSGKQNIAEGCSVSKTSPKNELFLLGVARGSLKELLEDYEDFLRQRRLEQWGMNDPRAVAVRRLAYGNPGSTAAGVGNYPEGPRQGGAYGAGGAGRSDKSDRADKSYTSYMDDPERAANAMITLINQTTYLLDQQIKAIEKQLEEKGISLETRDQKMLKSRNRGRKEETDFWEGQKQAGTARLMNGRMINVRDVSGEELDGLDLDEEWLTREQAVALWEKLHKTDMSDRSDNENRSGTDIGQKGFVKGNLLIVVGLVAALMLVMGVLRLGTPDRSGDRTYKTYTTYRSDRSDRFVFPASSPAVIPLGISVAEAQALPQGSKLIESEIAITGPQGERMNEMVEIGLNTSNRSYTSDKSDTLEYQLVVRPKDAQQFEPGLYHIAADIETSKGIRHITQDFLWGVLAINPNKSIYRPGETAKLAMAVLDEAGMMVCNAKVALQIQNPKSKS